MTSKDFNNMFKRNLLYIESEIDKIYQTDVMENAVRSRLTNALKKYASNLEDTCRYLISKDPKAVLRLLKEEEVKQDE